MMMSALDPAFTLSSDFYYRSLLAKVFRIVESFFCIPILRYTRRGEQPFVSSSPMKIQILLALHLMGGVNTTMDILGQLQVNVEIYWNIVRFCFLRLYHL